MNRDCKKQHPISRLLLSAAFRAAVSVVSLAVMALAALGAAGLMGIWALLEIGERDITLSERTTPFWPETLVPVDLLYMYSWAYLAGGLALLFLFLPFAMALLEKAVYAVRQWKDKSGARPAATRGPG